MLPRATITRRNGVRNGNLMDIIIRCVRLIGSPPYLLSIFMVRIRVRIRKVVFVQMIPTEMSTVGAD